MMHSGHAEIIEWFDYGGEPYHFSILTEAFGR